MGWALSTSVEALPAVLALCPPGVRVAAWHRGERPTRSRWPLHACEPVLYHGGRQLVTGARRTDSLVCGVGPLDTLPGRVIGAKPAAVCRWIFTLLGAAPGDRLDDLFLGSGAVSRAWAAYTGGDPSLPAAADASCQDPGDASSPAAGNGLDRSSSPASDVSCKARADASSPAVTGGLDPSGEALDDGCFSRWWLPDDGVHRAGVARVRSGQGLPLPRGFWPECP